LFAASVAGVVTHNVWSGPAAAVVGPCVTVITTSSVEFGQGEFEIVHRKVYVPTPPAGVKVEVGEVAFENWLGLVFGPAATDQVPLPTVAVFAASVAVPDVQIVWSEPAAAVVGVA
jgi:hypothetical protein